MNDTKLRLVKSLRSNDLGALIISIGIPLLTE